MTLVTSRGEKIRNFILNTVEEHPSNIAKLVSAQFKITRQGVSRYMRNLVKEGFLTVEGGTSGTTYKLASLVHFRKTYEIPNAPAEHEAWQADVAPVLGQLPEKAMRIWAYGFTEMFNNALEHSEGQHLSVEFTRTATTSEMSIYDDGVGIFKKIQRALNLLDERHSVLELAKGKFTTDPAHHTGQGIFFASRSFDHFRILSGTVYFAHESPDGEDWILGDRHPNTGTFVRMKLNNHTARVLSEIFDEYSDNDELAFTKTVVPVDLAQYGDDVLVSRSQAKRLLARVERFRTVMLDFKDVHSIGQGFADEIFRVFVQQHPEIRLVEINAEPEVTAMINRARADARNS